MTQARKRGVDFRDLLIEVDGDYDLPGYLALDDSVRPGYSGISYRVKVNTDAPAGLPEEVRAAAGRTSPMVDNIRNGAAVEARAESVG